LEKVIFELVTDEQYDVKTMLSVLEFVQFSVILNYVKDAEGRLHDLFIMELPLGKWREWWNHLVGRGAGALRFLRNYQARVVLRCGAVRAEYLDVGAGFLERNARGIEIVTEHWFRTLNASHRRTVVAR